MAYNKLNPLEKEMLIRLYRRNPNTTMSDFCAANNVSTGAFKNWVKKYDEGGLAALYRSKKEPTLLPEGVDENEENLRRELIRTRLELERLKKRLYPDPGRRWEADGVRAGIRKEYEIIESLSKEFQVKELCEIAGVSRSGYYKWRKRDGAPPDAKREETLRLVRECHEAHRVHGYRWVHAYLCQHEEGFSASADYVRRCSGYLGISAETKRKPGSRSPKREVKDPYPNLIFSTWDTVDRPRQVVVSDMTMFKIGWWRSYELVLYFDVFTKQIVGCGLGDGKGGNEHYHSGLRQAVASVERARENAVGKLGEGCGEITVFHTDQGSVYTSVAYNEIIKEAGIVRSCSRTGKPTDNPVNESLNGWIKEELFVDFHLADAGSFAEVAEIVESYVGWYNSERPCWSLGYMTPDAFYEAFMAGDVERKDTFADRVLDPTPKFVRERLAAAEEAAESNGGIGSSDPALFDRRVHDAA